MEMKLKHRLRHGYYAARYGRGCDFYCLFCGATYSKFLPTGVNRPVFKKLDVVGAGRRRNAKCPSCFSCDRTRLVYLYLKTQTNVFTGPSWVLDIAPGELLANEMLRAGGVTYVCGGLEPTVPDKYNPIHIDIQSIPFDAEAFDLVLCNHVLEYVPDDRHALREISRVLRPGGLALLQVPIARALETTMEGSSDLSHRETIRRFGHSANLRMYGLDYENHLAESGFRVVRRNPFTESWVADVQRHGLDPREDLFECTKLRGG